MYSTTHGMAGEMGTDRSYVEKPALTLKILHDIL